MANERTYPCLLHLFGMKDFNPADSYGSVIVVVPDPDALYQAFAAGLRAAYKKLPVAGIPRILRRRKKFGTVRGFSGRMEQVNIIKQKYEALKPYMDERMRRVWAAAEAKALGRGGISTVSSATGLTRKTIRAGLCEHKEQLAERRRT